MSNYITLFLDHQITIINDRNAIHADYILMRQNAGKLCVTKR